MYDLIFWCSTPYWQYVGMHKYLRISRKTPQGLKYRSLFLNQRKEDRIPILYLFTLKYKYIFRCEDPHNYNIEERQ